ncbi:CARDB domain-containing protein [Chloroflexota bacterium]
MVTLTATVENIEAGNASGDFYVRFEIDDSYIGRELVSGGLAAGGTIEVNRAWEAGAGAHAIKAIVDEYDVVTESDEGNNEYIPDPNLPPIPFPDLTITDLTWSPTGIGHGDTVTFTTTVENITDGNTFSDFYVRFEIDDAYIGHRLVSGGLAAHASTTVNINWTATQGTHTVKAIADEYNAVTESDEGNNEATQVLPDIPPPPQVTVTSPNGGEIWYGARDITWQATSSQGLDLTVRIELYNGSSYGLIAELANTGLYQQWDTSRYADGSAIPDSNYYKIRVTATDTNGVTGSDVSDNWFTIWNTPEVELSLSPTSQTTIENVNATYYITIQNKQPVSDTFDLIVNNIDGAAVAELSQDVVALDPWGNDNVTLNVTDESPGTYHVTVSAISQADASVGDEVTATTYVNPSFTVSISAPVTETSIGGELTYGVTLSNIQASSDDFTLSATGIDATWFSLDASCHLSAGEEKTVPLEISIPGTAGAGEYTILVEATSSSLGSTRSDSAPLSVSAAPLIFDLSPEDNARTGATDIVFTWTTSSDSTSEVFIKGEGEADYTHYTDSASIFHTVSVTGLARNTWYDFYVRSESPYGATDSEIRSIFITNGIIFGERTYEFTIERDYDQTVTISVSNTDDQPHELLLSISGVPEDLAVNFVGEGSIDQVVVLLPGESKLVPLVIHAQDALLQDYTLLLNLTTLGAEEINDSASLKLYVHFPLTDFALTEVGTAPYTLAKTLQVTNLGDPLTDLSISASAELSGILMFQPSISHMSLGTGGSVTFEAIPVLSEGFDGASGQIIASAAGAERTLAVDFGCAEGNQVFTGYYPSMTIEFAEGFDNDGIVNTNPSGETVDSYAFISGEEQAVSYLVEVMIVVKQSAEPAYGADVALEVAGLGLPQTYLGTTDLWGKALFTLFGPVADYSYQASIVGYPTSTPTRTFSVNPVPRKTVLPLSISWLNASDATQTFDLTDPAIEEVTLDTPPFTIRATKADLPEDMVPLLYLVDESYYANFEVIGAVDGDTLVFVIDSIDIGNYTATIAAQSELQETVSTSPSRKITFLDSFANDSQQLNYTYQLPFPIDEDEMNMLELDIEATETDPHKIVQFINVSPDETETHYIFTYMVIADHTMDDTIMINVTDSGQNILYDDTRAIHLEEYEAEFVNFPVPIFDAGARLDDFVVDFTMLDRSTNKSWFRRWVVDPAVSLGKGVRDRWNTDLLTPRSRVGVVAKCAFGFVSGGTVSTVAGITEIINKAWNSDWVGAGGGTCQQAIDPLINLQKKMDVANFQKTVEYIGEIYGTYTGKVAEYARMENLKRLASNLKNARNLSKIAKCVGWIGTAYSNYDDWKNVTDKQKKNSAKQTKTTDISVNNCINHSPLKNKFEMPSTIPQSLSPVQNVEGVFVTLHFPRIPPASYQPFDTLVMLNGHEIGRITNSVPQGYYTLAAEPSFLNYSEAGVATNTLTLDVEGMNRGYYVPLGGYKINIVFKQLKQVVCASDQAEANQIVEDLGRAMANQADFAILPADVRLSDPQPQDGDEVTIEATIHNLGSLGMGGVQVQLLDNDVVMESAGILYLPPFADATVTANWTATVGSHNIRVKVNPDGEIEESDYGNNEAVRAVTVGTVDSTLPVIDNPQPPDGSAVSDSTPVISADLADADSGINTSSVTMSVDGTYVTEDAIITSGRVWYTPLEPLSYAEYSVSVYAEDNRGNSNSLAWSFTVSEAKPVSSAGSIAPYWHNSDTFDVPFTANDDTGLSTITLWYRYSPDNTSWGAWASYHTDDTISGTSASGNFSFTCSDGEGYYEFYTIAEDDAGQPEDPKDVAEAEAGYDATPPSNPTPPATESGGVADDTWQDAVSDPDFTWSPSSDNLSGLNGYSVYWGADMNGTSENYTTEASYSPGAVVDHGIYYLRVQAKDNAGNIAPDWVTMFTFKYGIPPETGITKVADIWANPETYIGQEVTVSGEYRGWEAGHGSPPVTRSDWAIQDETGSIYVTGDSLGLKYPDDVGKLITVKGIVGLNNGEPYIEVKSPRPRGF